MATPSAQSDTEAALPQRNETSRERKFENPTDATLQTNGLTTMSFSRCHAMTLGRKSTSQHQELPKYMVEFGFVLASHLCAMF